MGETRQGCSGDTQTTQDEIVPGGSGSQESSLKREGLNDPEVVADFTDTWTARDPSTRDGSS